MAKKRRRRTRPTRPSVSATPTGVAPIDQPGAADGDANGPEDEAGTALATTEQPPATTRRPRREVPPPARGRFSERMRAPSPYPPLLSSLRQGYVAAAGTPFALVTAMLFVGGAWLGLTAAGLDVFPRTLVNALALPPVSSFYLDWLVSASIYGITASTVLVMAVLTLVRSLVWAILVGMMMESLEFGTVTLVGVLQGLRAFPSVLMIMAVNIFAVIFSIFLLPSILGGIGVLVFTAVLAGGLYLFPFATPAAVRGPLRGLEALRRSARAARMPGSRHLVMFVSYFFVVLMLVAFVPGGSIVTANAPFGEWAWVLGGTVVQLAFLAAFCQRWLVVEDQVPAGPPPRRPRPGVRISR
jgi:hypothetical protein